METRRAVRVVWLVLFLAFALFYAVGRFRDSEIGFHDLLRFSGSLLILATGPQILFWLVVSVTWQQTVAVTTGVRIRLLDSFSQLTVLTVGKYIPGKLWGMVARGVQLKQSAGLTGQQVIRATFVEQYYFLGTALVISGVLYGFKIDQFWGMASLVAAVFVGLVAKRAYVPLLRVVSWLVASIGRRAHWRMPDTSDLVVSWRGHMRLLGLNLAIWLLSGIVFYSIYVAMDHSSGQASTLALIVLANAVAVSLGFLALFAPGGIGVREGISTIILAPHLSIETALALSLLFRGWVVVTEFVSVGLTLAIIARRRKEVNPA